MGTTTGMPPEPLSGTSNPWPIGYNYPKAAMNVIHYKTLSLPEKLKGVCERESMGAHVYIWV